MQVTKTIFQQVSSCCRKLLTPSLPPQVISTRHQRSKPGKSKTPIREQAQRNHEDKKVNWDRSLAESNHHIWTLTGIMEQPSDAKQRKCSECRLAGGEKKNGYVKPLETASRFEHDYCPTVGYGTQKKKTVLSRSRLLK